MIDMIKIIIYLNGLKSSQYLLRKLDMIKVILCPNELSPVNIY